jgi:hypothetical protein
MAEGIGTRRETPDDAPAAETVRPGALSALLEEIARAPSAADAWAEALRPGLVVGKFELVREIGRGGFGVVWEARDRELGRSVAFKAVRPGGGGTTASREDRLVREADAAARLTHPNLVTLYDLGRSAQGPYLVLELLRGATLEERLSHGRVPVREAIRIATEVARGVAHAHAHGVVHRDLKPANVFLCEDGQVKVLDFGLAHAFGQRRQDGGTPAYMAPEQWQGAPEDERTDVFALGVLVYQLLSGELPFRADGGKAVLSHRPAPALAVDGLPALGVLVARALAKSPVARPRDGAEIATALEGIRNELEGALGATPAARVSLRASRGPWRRRGALVAAAGAIAAVLAVAVVRERASVAGADRRVVVAVADVVNETGEKELDVLSGLLVTSLEQSRRLSVMTQARVLDLAARAGRADAVRVDETIGREVGRAHGVRALLLPAIRRLGTTYSLEMRALDPVRDEHLFTVSDRAVTKEALLELLDRLSERTRAELGEGQVEVGHARIELGRAMTLSVEAYQHYLRGLDAWHRDGLRAAAMREFEDALRLDGSFAAAQGQLADLLHHGYGMTGPAAPHWQAANTGLDGMPEKERLLFRLRRAHAEPSLEHVDRGAAIRLADEVLARFPDDKYALMAAAEAFETFDLPDRWEPAARRAVALDPGYFWAAASLAEWLGARTAEAAEVARVAVATRRNAANLSILATALWAAGDEEGAARVARETLAADGGGRNSLLAWRACSVLVEKGLGAECEPVWRRMSGEGLNEHERNFARRELITSLALQGRVREAERLARSTPGFSTAVSPWLLFGLALVGKSHLHAPGALEAARRIVNPQVRRNALTWVGALDEAEAITLSLAGKGYEIVEKNNRAMAALIRGRAADAAALFAEVRAEASRRNFGGTIYGLAFAHAEALLAAGRAEEAASTWPATPPCRCSDAMDRGTHGPALRLVRARALESLGRREDALREVELVLASWKEADPDLPLLVEGKAMMKRLAPAPPVERDGSAAGEARP